MRKIVEHMSPILDLLDKGWAIYRRHFPRFVLIGMAGLAPIAAMIVIDLLAGDAEGDSMSALIDLAGVILAALLLLSLIGGLSRAAAAAIDGRAIDLREALAIHPLGVVKAGYFAVIYGLFTQIVPVALGMLGLVLYDVGFFLSFSSLDSFFPDPGAGYALTALSAVMFALAFLVAVSGVSSIIYGLQPWFLERLRFGEAKQRSIALLRFRFRSNLIVWGLSALLVIAVSALVGWAVDAIVPLWALLPDAESPTANAVTRIVQLLWLALAAPLWVIWMTLLYQRNLAMFNGVDLAQRIETWRRR